MRYRKLGKTGLDVSVIGFGASPLGDVFRTINANDGERAVHFAIDEGINFFDVSPYYGRTLAEARLGNALRGRRTRVVLATKCGRYDTDRFDFSAQRIKRSIEESLGRLQTDYVDLLQAHDIEFGDAGQILEETIPALREIQREGKARHIGITSYQLRMQAEIASAGGVDSVLSYCRYNLLIDDMEALLTPVLRQRDIGLILASPLHMGLLTNTGATDWHPAPEAVKAAAREVVRSCEVRGVEPCVAALRYCLDHPYAATTLVGMSSPGHVRRNLRALDFQLDPNLLEDVRQKIRPALNVVWLSGKPENADYSRDTILSVQNGLHKSVDTSSIS